MPTITDKLIVSKQSGVGRIAFDNPDRRNAMTFEMWQGLPLVIDDFLSDPAVRVIEITGNGDKAFCAGADISEFSKNRSSEDAVNEYNAAVSAASDALANAGKPTIARIKGFCVGGGVGIALCCDLRFASAESRFAVPAAKLGLGYGATGLKRLVDVVGPSMAKEIFFTARQFDAHEAAAMGLVNRIQPVAELDGYVDDIVGRIAGNAPITIHAAKVVIDQLVRNDGPPDEALCDKVVDDCFASEDYEEGRKAFMEKRIPNFQGK